MRGRPVKSEIRQNIIDILHVLKQGYGYEICRIYLQIFPKCTKESIYYHLRKGVTLDEFKIIDVKTEEGQFSWGPVAEKKYYALSDKAQPRISKRVSEHIKHTKSKRALAKNS